MTILSDDTHKIASSMDNFSGWLRARLRQYDEGVDTVELELMKNHLRKRFQVISEVVLEVVGVEINTEIWDEFNKRMAQSKLGDF